MVHKVSTKYGQDISNELKNKIKVNIVTPVYLTEVLVRYATWEALVFTVQRNIQADRQARASMIRAAATADPLDAELPMNISILDNKTSKVNDDIANEIQI